MERESPSYLLVEMRLKLASNRQLSFFNLHREQGPFKLFLARKRLSLDDSACNSSRDLRSANSAKTWMHTSGLFVEFEDPREHLT
jgi:hypothetical protein